MTHIANCMRSDPDQMSFYITLDESCCSMVRLPSPPPPPRPAPPQMNYHLPRRSRSLRETHASQDTAAPTAPSQPPASSKYQLWPAAKSPPTCSKSSYASDKLAALSAGRSPTSLSDTALPPESSLPFWQRTGSLSRRRKVSVPELGNTMTTVQEMPIDSRKSFFSFVLSFLSCLFFFVLSV